MNCTIRNWVGETDEITDVIGLSRKYPDQEGAVETSVLTVQYIGSGGIKEEEYEGGIVEDVSESHEERMAREGRSRPP